MQLPAKPSSPDREVPPTSLPAVTPVTAQAPSGEMSPFSHQAPPPTTGTFPRDERTLFPDGWPTVSTAQHRDPALLARHSRHESFMTNTPSGSAALLDDHRENNEFRAGPNGSLDMDFSRREDSFPMHQNLGHASHPSLTSSRGTNGSPAMQEPFAFPRGHHTPNNSTSLPRQPELPAPAQYSPHVPFSQGHLDLLSPVAWQAQQNYDPSNSLAGLSRLSLNDRPASSAGSTAFSSAPQGFGAGLSAQGWANNGQSGQSSMIPRDLATFLGVTGSVAGSSEDVPQHAAPNRGLVPGHGEPSFAPTFAPTFAPQAGQHPLSQLHQPQGNWGQQRLSRDSVGFSQVNVGAYNQMPTGVGYSNGGFTERAGSGPNVNNYPYGAFQTTGYPVDLPQPQTNCRQVFVEEYKRNKPHHRWDLEDFFGNLAQFSEDRTGAEFIQRSLDVASPPFRDRVFQELRYSALKLMRDIYGNYVIQRLFEVGTQEQKMDLVTRMKPQLNDLSCHVFAGRVVQAAFDYVDLETQLELLHVLEPNMVRLIKDKEANHVVQKAIDMVERRFLDPIMDAMRGQIAQLSKQKFGCRIVQKIIDKGTDKDRKDIFDEYYHSAGDLAAHEFGNYVAQALLRKGSKTDRAELITHLTPLAVKMSYQQAASNVVENCIMLGTLEQARRFRQEFAKSGPDGRPHLVAMMLSVYSNYAIQRLYQRFGPSDGIDAAIDGFIGRRGRSVTPPDQGVGFGQGVNSGQGRTADQESFRQEVQAAMDMLTNGELIRGQKPLGGVADALDLRIPEIRRSPTAPAAFPVGAGRGGRGGRGGGRGGQRMSLSSSGQGGQQQGPSAQPTWQGGRGGQSMSASSSGQGGQQQTHPGQPGQGVGRGGGQGGQSMSQSSSGQGAQQQGHPAQLPWQDGRGGQHMSPSTSGQGVQQQGPPAQPAWGGWGGHPMSPSSSGGQQQMHPGHNPGRGGGGGRGRGQGRRPWF